MNLPAPFRHDKTWKVLSTAVPATIGLSRLYPATPLTLLA